MSDRKFELFNGDYDGEESYLGIAMGSFNADSSQTMLMDHRYIHFSVLLTKQ